MAIVEVKGSELAGLLARTGVASLLLLPAAQSPAALHLKLSANRH